MKSSTVFELLRRAKWTLAVTGLGAAVAVSGAGLKWGGFTA